MKDMVFCYGCGKEHHRTAARCPHCGASRLRSQRYKSKVAAGVLGLLIGGLGVHRFYLGQWWGIFYLLFCWTMIPGLISFIEGIVMLCTDQEKWDEKYNDGISGGEGSSGSVVIIAVVVVVVGIAVVGILAAIAIPAYQEYVMRAKVANAVLLANHAGRQVSRYVQQNRTMPASLSAAGFNDPVPRDIQSMEINEQSGVITVTMSGSVIDGQSFVLRPTRNAEGSVAWQCEGDGIREKYLPRVCRKSQ